MKLKKFKLKSPEEFGSSWYNIRNSLMICHVYEEFISMNFWNFEFTYRTIYDSLPNAMLHVQPAQTIWRDFNLN